MKKSLMTAAVLLATATMISAQQSGKAENAKTKTEPKTPPTIHAKSSTTAFKTEGSKEVARSEEKGTQKMSETSAVPAVEPAKPVENSKNAPPKKYEAQ